MSEEKNKDPRAAVARCEKRNVLPAARRIASALLTAYTSSGGIEGTRLQIMQKQADGTERNLGGRNRRSIEQEVDRVLREMASKDESFHL